jgi:recombination protein RecA
LKDGDLVVGNRTKVTVVKNKIAPPFRKVEFDILFNRGISKEGELVDLGQQAGIVVKSGTWYSMKHPTDGEIRLGQGMERTRQFLIDNPDITMVIEEAVRAELTPKSDEPDPQEPASGEGDSEGKAPATAKDPAKAAADSQLPREADSKATAGA